MVDRAPPSRFSVVERGGRLVVIDRETGQTPLSAAERMALHDRNLGIETIRPERPSSAPDVSAAARAESGLSARPAPNQPPAAVANAGKPRPAAAKPAPARQPWSQTPGDRPALKADAAPGRMPSRAAPQGGARMTPQGGTRMAPQSGARKTIVTGKWWDAKGPRTIELGAKGQQTLSGGFVTLFFVLVTAAIVALFVEPLILFVGAFVLFRFGGSILGPIGAALVDKALAERG